MSAVTHVRFGLASLLVLHIALATPGVAQATTAGGDPMRLLGLSVATSGGPRDTLGLLVASVTRDGPADQAGITTGNRILAVNGQVTRLGADEVGRRTASDSAISRFMRAVRGAPASGEVTLKVSGGGATRTVALPLTGVVTEPNPAPPPRPTVTPVTADPKMAPSPQPVATPAPVSTTPPAEPSILHMPGQVVVVTPSRTPNAAPAATPAPSPVVAMPQPVSAPATVPVDSTTTRSTPQPVAPPVVIAPSAVAVSDTRADAAHDATLPRIVDLLGQVQLELRRVARESSSLSVSDSLADLEWQLSEIRRRLRAVSGVSVTPAADSAATRVDSNSVLARWLRAADRIDARAAAKPTAGRGAAVPVVPPAAVAPAVSAPAVSAPAVSAPAVSAPAVSAPAVAAPTPVAPTVAQAAVVPAAPVAAAAPSSGIELAPVSGDLAAYLGAQAESAVVVVKATDAYEPLRAGDVVLQADGAAPNLERLRTALASHARVSLTLLRRSRVFTVLVGEAAH